MSSNFQDSVPVEDPIFNILDCPARHLREDLKRRTPNDILRNVLAADRDEVIRQRYGHSNGYRLTNVSNGSTQNGDDA
jgi:hypothetical protein